MSAEDIAGTAQDALATYSQIISHWSEGGYRFQYKQFQADFLGITVSRYDDLMLAPEPELDAGLLQRIDYIANIAAALSCLFNYKQIEIEWLERLRYTPPDLESIVGTDTVADYLIAKGLAGFARINDYLQTKVTRAQTNERHLLCLGICNTLIEVPLMYSDPFVELLALTGRIDVDPETMLRKAMDVAPTFANAIPLGGKVVLLKRPHLQDLVHYVHRQPNLDVAIITSATREFVDLAMGKAAPELLALCKFVWTREDGEKFLRRTGDGYQKILCNIPELMSYQLGRILIMEHNRVHPPELHLRIPAYVFYPECPELQDQDNGIPEIIRRLDILLQVDDVLTLRREEHAQYIQLAQQRSDWIAEQGISLFDNDYSQRMQSCQVPAFKAIDG